MITRTLVLITTLFVSAANLAAPRDIQIRTVNLSLNTVELYNFGVAAQPLNGWQLCTHDADEVNQCSSTTGFNGITLNAGESLFIHYNNNATQSNQVNRSALGGNLALPLDPTAYSMQLLFAPADLNNGNTYADHLQWNIDGLHDAVADERSDEAQAGAVWVNQNLWIETSSNTGTIALTDVTGFTNHMPSNYNMEFTVPIPMVFVLLLACLLMAVRYRQKMNG